MESLTLNEACTYFINEVVNIAGMDLEFNKDLTDFDDSQLANNPIYQKMKKTFKSSFITEEQAVSLFALTILVQNERRSGFDKDVAKQAIKSFIPSGLTLSALYFLLTGPENGLKAALIAAIVTGVLSVSLGSILLYNIAKGKKDKLYDWAVKWAINHDWVDKEGNILLDKQGNKKNIF